MIFCKTDLKEFAELGSLFNVKIYVNYEAKTESNHASRTD